MSAQKRHIQGNFPAKPTFNEISLVKCFNVRLNGKKKRRKRKKEREDEEEEEEGEGARRERGPHIVVCTRK